MANTPLDPIFESQLEGVGETTYEDVKEFMDTLLTKSPHHIIIEEFEKIAEYVVLLEKILDEKEIDFSEDILYSKKAENFDEIEDQKRLFLLHFAGGIVRKESSTI